jgi:sterol desaturase/sphingolipid hydroxylase (fatty acid hydroxylase superfamily)
MANSVAGRRLGKIGLAAVVAVVLAANPSVLVGIAALFVLVVPFERLFPRHRQRFRRPGLGTDLLYGLTQRGLAVAGLVVGLAIGVVSLAWLPGLAVRPLVAILPAPARVLAGFVLFDAIVYWGHRWGHELPFLWRFHAVHHSSSQMDWVSGLRTHPFDGLVVTPALVFLFAAGFPARLGGVLVILQLAIGLFLHANVRWRWYPLQRIVNTPELHHWHHSNELDARNRNYCTFLPIWDLLFGTFFMPAGRRPQVYGIDQEMPSSFTGQLVHPLRGLPTPWSVARHPVLALRRLGVNLRRGLGQLIASTRRIRPATTSAG